MSKLFYPAGSEVERQALARRLRELLQHEGRLPKGALPVGIEASWLRSLAHGVDCHHQSAADSLPAADLSGLLDAHAPLLQAAGPELSWLVRQYGADGVVTLADAEAKVLAVRGRQDRLAELGIDDLSPGTCWHESQRGTNALGTALVERSPVLVDVGEHYLQRLSQFACASVPIHDPSGAVAAVLDVTCEGALKQPRELLSQLTQVASRIENRWACRVFADHLVLACHSHRPFLGTHWRALLVVDETGILRAANPHAASLFDLPHLRLAGLSAELLFDQPWVSLRDRLLSGETVSCGSPTRPWHVQCLNPASAEPAAVDRLAQVGGQSDRVACVASVGLSRTGALPADTGVGRAPVEVFAPTVTAGCPKLAQTLLRAARGLANDVPVLLLGETGSGKEVTARALHQASPRAGKPFVAVNCAAIPEGLIESELFGYAAGAFTGARRGGATGILMQAHGGTLFLDEIGDMPAALQTRLLRVLQERRVMPLGGGAEQPLDIALICATHRDLPSLIQAGSFREDLYYRIDGFSVCLPSLRNRADLPILVDALLMRLGAPDVKVSALLLRHFAAYHWPGNIRQLEMVLRTALAVRDAHEQELCLQHLGDSFREALLVASSPSSPSAASAALPILPTDSAQLETDETSAGVAALPSIRAQEVELIQQALAAHANNISAAARSLGIARATLYRKMKRLGMNDQAQATGCAAQLSGG
ncbi:MAG: sigma-54-dependent Fis family transcriptional regulator [Lautropia sp.]|nr:sigma-54-dependent Fis family transcriptional regulator [Lautropia sp.]